MKWLISDLHIDHARVLVGPRGDAFPTIEDWQDHILGQINRLVQKSDQLFLLGDFAFKRLSYWRQKIKHGQVWLIKGNHDPSDSECAAVFGRNQFRHVHMTKLCGVPTWLSHYAHAFWPQSHYGSYHAYGHTHGMREDTLDQWMPERRSIEVCPEVIYQVTGEWRPINEHEVHEVLSKRAGHDPVQYYKDQRGEYTQEPLVE